MKIQRWVCEKCESPHVEYSGWIQSNSNIPNDNVDIDGYWCHDCGIETNIELKDGIAWEVTDEHEFIDLEVFGLVPFITYESTNLIDWFYIGHCVLKAKSDVNEDEQAKIYQSEPFKLRKEAVRDLCKFINNIEN